MTAEGAAGFADHFSAHAAEYAAHRPRYPTALFDWLSRIAPGAQVAWDAGTGSGQVAHGLATRFARVVATDASAEQIANALPHPRIAYAVARYECGLPDASAQLVTAGQAIHWFDVDAFCAEARRVLQRGGVLAAFAYGHNRVTPAVDEVVRHHHDVTLARHWPRERSIIFDGYRDLPLPIHEQVAPPFEMQEEWSLDQFVGYLRTWSATQRFLAAGGEAVIAEFEAGLRQRWGDAPTRSVRWPLVIRAGVVH